MARAAEEVKLPWQGRGRAVASRAAHLSSLVSVSFRSFREFQGPVVTFSQSTGQWENHGKPISDFQQRMSYPTPIEIPLPFNLLAVGFRWPFVAMRMTPNIQQVH